MNSQTEVSEYGQYGRVQTNADLAFNPLLTP